MIIHRHSDGYERAEFARIFPQLNTKRNDDGTFWNAETELCFSFWLAGVQYATNHGASPYYM